MKTCSLCKVVKPHSDFRRDNSKPCGYRSQCKECTDPKDKAYRSRPDRVAKNNERTREQYRNNPARRAWLREYQKEWMREKNGSTLAKSYQGWLREFRGNHENL